MNLKQIVALVLILLGILGLVYRNISYTKETHEAKFGPLELSVKEKETIDIPVWGSAGAILAGTLLLLLNKKK